MDPLEKFIHNNRDAFDRATPPDHLFDDIRFNDHPTKTKRLYSPLAKWSFRAAAAILIFVTAWFMNDLYDQKNNDMAMNNKAKSKNREMIYELREAEAFYTARISNNLQRIATLTSSRPGLLESVNTDIEELDIAYGELKKDLGDNAANTEVVEAMIQNYRLKLDILEQILSQIEEKNNPQNNDIPNYEI